MSYTVNITEYLPVVNVNVDDTVVQIGSTVSNVVVNTNPSVFGTVPVPGATGAQGPIGPRGYSYNVTSNTTVSSTATVGDTIVFSINTASSYVDGSYVRAIQNGSGYGASSYIEGLVDVTTTTITMVVDHVNLNTGLPLNNWAFSIAGLPGLQGPTGATGFGATGPQGATGPTGPQGATGPSGSYNQSLNTTDSPTFAAVNLGGSVNINAYNAYSISGTTPIAIGSMDTATFRVAKFINHISDSGSYQVEEILLFSDGTDVSFTRYGEMDNNGLLGSYSYSITSGVVSLVFTPTGATSMSVNSQITYLA